MDYIFDFITVPILLSIYNGQNMYVGITLFARMYLLSSYLYAHYHQETTAAMCSTNTCGVEAIIWILLICV